MNTSRAILLNLRNHIVNTLQLAFMLAVAAALAFAVFLAYYFIWVPSALFTEDAYASLISNESCFDAGQMHILHVINGVSAIRSFTFYACCNLQMWANVAVLGVGCAVIYSAYAVILFCAFKIKRKIKNASYSSRSAKTAESQINLALLFQVRKVVYSNYNAVVL